MISVIELKNICTERLEDAKTLLKANRYEGAFYMCGYVIELALKSKICSTLGWLGYPSSAKEFENFKSFKTHDLEVLLHLSGAENQIKKNFFPEWSVVASWNPEIRYSIVRQTAQHAELMLTSAETLINNL